MKSVLISIQPKWCELIASGKKTVEVRKTAPKLQTPFKCYIYCTESDVHSCLMVSGGETKLIHCCNYKTAIPVGGEIGNGKVIGEFVCDRIDKYSAEIIACAKFEVNGAEVCEEFRYNSGACLDAEAMFAYSKGKPLYGWHISNLKIYDKPNDLEEFRKPDEPFHAVKNTERGIVFSDGWKQGEPIECPPQSWCYVEGL